MKKIIAMTLTIALVLGLLTIPAAAITPGSWDIPGGVYKDIMEKVTAEEKAKQEAAEQEAADDAEDDAAEVEAEPEPESEAEATDEVGTEEYPHAVRYQVWNWDELRSRWRAGKVS